MKKVVVSLTTIPERLHDTHYGERGLYSCIKSLCDQTIEDFDYTILFCIPRTYKLKNTKYTIPKWLIKLETKNKNKLILFRCIDHGPSTKIIPALQYTEKDLETIIIVVDDDQVYHPDMVKEHVKNQNLLENCAVGYDGLGVINPPVFYDIRDHYVSLVPNNTRVKVLQHYKSVSYKRKYFGEDFEREFVGKTTSDDILLSAYMGSRDIQKVVATYSGDTQPKDIDEWNVLVGRSFPIISPIAHDPQQGCSDPEAGERFHRPLEFEQKGFLEK